MTMIPTAHFPVKIELRRLVERPLPLAWAVGVGLAVLIAGAAYCMGYAALSGSANEWARAVGWSAGAVLPWLLAFELLKRMDAGPTRLRWPLVMLVLLATGIASLGVEAAIDRWLWHVDPAPVALQLLRRFPAICVVLLLILVRRGARAQPDAADHPTLVAKLRYVRAADNYVELYYPDRMRMERATLSQMERRLAPSGFVRVHRSILVHPRHVSRLEPNGRTPCLVLHDGARLPTGDRYRAAFRHFVP